jgi:hypothetical protein
MDAETVATRAETKALREEMAIMRNKWVNNNRDETLACQEMEARQEEKKPTSPDRKPETAQKDEDPVDDAEAMPVGEPKKKGVGTEKWPRSTAARNRSVDPRWNWPSPVEGRANVQRLHGKRQ